MAQTLIVRSYASPLDYEAVWQAMKTFTQSRQPDTPDELWLLEHLPVYTQGQAGNPEHCLRSDGTPLVHSDRGGQVTWHGPGQLMVYTLLDTRRLQLGARALVNTLETALLDVLARLNIHGHTRKEAPGLYVTYNHREAKIAAVGLRIRQRGCYHGAALNLHCALDPFHNINPCGYPGQAVTRLRDLVTTDISRAVLEPLVIHALQTAFGYHAIEQAFYHD